MFGYIHLCGVSRYRWLTALVFSLLASSKQKSVGGNFICLIFMISSLFIPLFFSFSNTYLFIWKREEMKERQIEKERLFICWFYFLNSLNSWALTQAMIQSPLLGLPSDWQCLKHLCYPPLLSNLHPAGTLTGNTATSTRTIALWYLMPKAVALTAMPQSQLLYTFVLIVSER